MLKSYKAIKSRLDNQKHSQSIGRFIDYMCNHTLRWLSKILIFINFNVGRGPVAELLTNLNDSKRKNTLFFILYRNKRVHMLLMTQNE